MHKLSDALAQCLPAWAPFAPTASKGTFNGNEDEDKFLAQDTDTSHYTVPTQRDSEHQDALHRVSTDFVREHQKCRTMDEELDGTRQEESKPQAHLAALHDACILC